ncbi:MAG: restriction endonuclease subunit S [Thermoplasmatales archaeon]|nr:restriction endonuclease subunit S [Thermoplasmatales archaeon]
MAVVSIVKLSELEGAKRIDPEFYHPENVISKKILEKVGTRRIKDCFCSVRQIFDPQRHVLNDTAFVFNLSDVKSFFLSGGKIALSSDDVGSAKKMFSQNDVLISRLRPYLKEVSFIGFNGKIKLCSTEFIVLRQKNKNYYPEVLFSFLITPQVQNILLWSISGTEHPRFHEDYFLNLKLPNFTPETQNKIKELVNDAWKFFSNSQSLYSQAENLLLEELGLKDFMPKYELSYTANISEAFKAHRIDAEYFQPAYDTIVEKIIEYSNGHTSLLNFVDSIKPDFDPTKYPDKTFSYVELADVDESIGIIHSANEVKGEEAPSRARRVLKQNDVIISSVEGSLEKVALVNEEYEGSLASTGFFQFRAIKILPQVLLVLSKSIVVQFQLKKECAGTILTAVPTESLKRILIPIIPDETQQKIASLVQQSHEARRKAKELLEEAKRKVEEAIENEIGK